MKKKYWYLIGFVAIVIIVIWRVNSIVDVTVDNEFPSNTPALYSGKVTGVSDYGKIMVYHSASDKDGFPVSVDDKGNYSFELERHHYPMIEYLLSLRDVKELTNEEMDSLISEDKLCILCYENPSNTELIPCKHRCCSNCYNQYKIDKDICFICQKKN